MAEKRRVHVVPHTHWDREWYLPFQAFRLKLVELVDDLLPLLDRDPSFRHFQMDGQMACVDDYLAIRPEEAPRIARFAAAGRITMGPWYTLPDEFLVSGESLIRNLQAGIEAASRFGGAMEVGYLPDMFGHIAQMPQIFRLFGFDTAVVWRGVPSAVDRSSFFWEAPDGSAIRTEYLPLGYGNGAHLRNDPEDLLERIVRFEDDHADTLLGPILWMNGTDHLMPQPWLGRLVSEANALSQRYELVVSSLPEYLAASRSQVAVDDLPTWQGELRSGARANLLMGVTSNRTDIRQLAARAERGLEQLAEPLAALFDAPERWPGGLLAEAWHQVILNEAHDSICACSVDEVCDAVAGRFKESLQITDGLTERINARFAATVEGTGPVVTNPSGRPRSGIITIDVPGEGAIEGFQLLRQRPTTVDLPVTRTQARQFLEGMLDFSEGCHKVEIDEVDDGVVITLHRDPQIARRVSSAAVWRELETIGDPTSHAPITLRVVRPAARRLLAPIESVPGFGWKSVDTTGSASPAVAPVVCSELEMSNGRVQVTVNPGNGTWTIDGHTGLGQLVDGGDNGDTYNYNEPHDDRLVDTPESVDVTAIEQGGLRSRIQITASYRWPDRIDGQTRSGGSTVVVTTTLEVRAGESFVRVETSLDNQTRDHRLRVHFPLPRRATGSRAECAFTVVERGLLAEGGPTERALATYPSRRFVQAGGLTVAHEGLLEYELIDLDTDQATAGTLALTLLRCTGMLSQGPMRYRPLPAGPLTPLEGSQLQGPITLRYAVAVGDDVDPYMLAEDAFVPLLVGERIGVGSRPLSGTHLDLECFGAKVSAVRRVGPNIELRVFNPNDEPTALVIPGRAGWVVDLRGRPQRPFDGTLGLGPHAIATVVLAEPEEDPRNADLRINFDF